MEEGELREVSGAEPHIKQEAVPRVGGHSFSQEDDLSQTEIPEAITSHGLKSGMILFK